MDTGLLHGPLDFETALGYGGFVTLEDQAAYERHMEDVEAEHEAYQKAGGKAICPKCSVRALKDKAVPTRQYGGGWDTYYHCDNCGYTDVAT